MTLPYKKSALEFGRGENTIYGGVTKYQPFFRQNTSIPFRCAEAEAVV